MPKLLVVDDDRMFNELVCRAMREQGYAVDGAQDYAGARALAFVHDYDGMVLDVVLPDGSGLHLVRDLRREGRSTPVLMLTANDKPADVVRGLDAGADDYLAKPFDLDVLTARVRALVRRGAAYGEVTALAFGGLELERERHRLTIGGKRVSCTPREFALLAYLIERAERIVTRTELLDKVWDVSFDPGSNVVDVHVARLRVKLREFGARPRLVTVRGAGYMLTLGEADADAG
jgi:DNA-binding response OmpR family regulator